MLALRGVAHRAVLVVHGDPWSNPDMLSVATALLSFAPHTFTTPTIEIASGVHLPLVGIGTWQYNDSVTEAAVLSALSMGYEHVDTAAGYANAAGVARALERSGRARASYFVTSKIPGGLNESVAAAALDANLAALRLAHVDLMLVHFPATWGGEGGKAARQAEWRALEAFVRAGKARAIGVSHFCRRHVEDILEIATIKPAVNQVQFHVGMGMAGPTATDDRAWLRQQGITYHSNLNANLNANATATATADSNPKANPNSNPTPNKALRTSPSRLCAARAARLRTPCATDRARTPD